VLIGLDYDGTYSRDPKTFDKIITLFTNAGHKVICITMRRWPEEQIIIPNIDVVYTDRRAKLLYAEENGIKIDIWIDDKPRWLLNDG
jgi:hydroxymethylpyrimidine pyrophosphatase-like HAD family hydrolase